MHVYFSLQFSHLHNYLMLISCLRFRMKFYFGYTLKLILTFDVSLDCNNCSFFSHSLFINFFPSFYCRFATITKIMKLKEKLQTKFARKKIFDFLCYKNSWFLFEICNKIFFSLHSTNIPNLKGLFLTMKAIIGPKRCIKIKRTKWNNDYHSRVGLFFYSFDFSFIGKGKKSKEK